MPMQRLAAGICTAATRCSTLLETHVRCGGGPHDVEKVPMRTPSAIRRAAVSGLAAALLAASAGAVAAAPAIADDDCLVLCITSDKKTPPPKQNDPPQPGPAPTKPAPPVQEPVPTAPAPPPAPPAPAPAPEPAPVTEAATPTPEPTAEVLDVPSPSETPWTPSARPSTESNWNKPIKKQSAEPSNEAALMSFNGPGAGLGPLAAIMGGVFLIGIAGLAFAWWARSRFSSH